MVILNAQQIRDWDAYTIANAPIASIDLMEHAATCCYEWLIHNQYAHAGIHIFCGKGNNGGDGLAIARMLVNAGCLVTVHILELGKMGSIDFQKNLARLHETTAAIHYIQSPEHFPTIPASDTIIDALFGTGLSRVLDGLSSELVAYINNLGNKVIAIDLPSGMLPDNSSSGAERILATITLSFQCLKMAFLMPENADYTGKLQVLDIGLLAPYLLTIVPEASYVEAVLIQSLYKPRNAFSHKGNFGHAALIAGSYGMMGAATLAAKGCLRSGAGKLTCFIPTAGYAIMQIAVPEAMVKMDGGEQFIESLGALDVYSAIGIGPGWGKQPGYPALLQQVFTQYRKPMLVDADALNVLAGHQELLKQLPAISILCPHPAEFDRIFGKQENDFARMELARRKAIELQCIIILKGHRTLIAMPGGTAYFNSTGNAGMATAGSGDVLTGILTGLLASGYSPEKAALLGVYLHGLAGDFAAASMGEEALLAGDIIEFMVNAFLDIRGK
jgi:NAD(P)H-hydrate epimerase